MFDDWGEVGRSIQLDLV